MKNKTAGCHFLNLYWIWKHLSSKRVVPKFFAQIHIVTIMFFAQIHIVIVMFFAQIHIVTIMFFAQIHIVTLNILSLTTERSFVNIFKGFWLLVVIVVVVISWY